MKGPDSVEISGMLTVWVVVSDQITRGRHLNSRYTGGSPGVRGTAGCLRRGDRTRVRWVEFWGLRRPGFDVVSHLE